MAEARALSDRTMKSSFQYRQILLAAPYLAFLLLAFIVPFGLIATYSITSNGTMPSGAQYARILHEPAYWRVAANTAVIALVVTFCCGVLGFPVALFLTRTRNRMRSLALSLVLVPFWTSLLVRTYAWLVLLQRHGVVNSFLARLGIISEPLSLVHNRVGVVIGMTYVMLPFMVLSIYSALKTADSTLPMVAATLGAGRLTIFWRVLVPLGRSGLIAGSFLVFILSLGYFITPALLGGLSETTIGMVIEAQMNRLLDWNFGSALAVSLTITVLALAVCARRFLDPKYLGGEES